MDKNSLFINFPWSLAPEDILTQLSFSNGLSDHQVKARRKLAGRNLIPSRRHTKKLWLFLNQLKSPLIFILLIAGFVTVFLHEYGDAAVIFAAVFTNTFLGFYQENKAEDALLKLETYLKHHALVLRSGHEQKIPTEDLVPGDIIILMPGQRVAADARLLSADSLYIDEAILTGESLPVKKHIKSIKKDSLLADRSSMVWSGSLVVEGVGRAVVTSTGQSTEIGRIAELVRTTSDDSTPLQKAISSLTIKLSLILSALITLLFGMGVYLGQDIVDMFITSVAVAVSAIPEGLPIALTVILAVGVERMAKKKGIVRRLLAAETLGSTTLILTDKTGTLTEARMSLSQVIPVADKSISIKDVLRVALLATEAVIEKADGQPDSWSVLGRPLEVSLIKESPRFSVSPLKIKKDYHIEDQLLFNSRNKYSAVVFSHNSNKFIGVLGAPDILLNKSELSDSNHNSINAQINQLAYSGEKVLGIAIKKIPSAQTVDFDKPSSLSNLTFYGLLSFRDPVRQSVKQSIQQAHRLGVKTVIVTGDHQGTAEAVAREAGFDLTEAIVISGHEFSKLGEDKLKKMLPQIKIFARVTPEQKLQIAKLYKDQGEVVAMTGDGVNDAPALKEANIGVAVGSGTEVAKGAADLIITDDNFGTIVSAIIEGRQTLNNIKKVIVYLFSSIIDELVLVGGALLTGVSIPLTAIQILWVNFFSDSFPAIGLAFENSDGDLKRSPNSLKQGLLDAEMKFLIMVIGGATSILLFATYYWLLKIGQPEDLVRTFTFAAFGLYTLMFAFSMRDLKKSILKYNIFSNDYLTAGIGIGVILMLLAIYFPPLQNIMNTTALSPLWFSGVLLVGLVSVIAVEWGKWLFREKVSK